MFDTRLVDLTVGDAAVLYCAYILGTLLFGIVVAYFFKRD